MSNPDALVWGGKDGSSARAGMGSAFIVENQSAQVVKDTLNQVEQDRRRIENAEKQRVMYGRMGDIKIKGWDVDRNRQLSAQLQETKKYFTDAMSSNRNPLDYQNAEEYGKYTQMVSDLEANMNSSEGQHEFYKGQLKLLTQDRGKNFDYDKSMEKLEKYRNASIAEREDMGADMLVPRISTPLDIMREEIKAYKKQTNQGQWYVEDGVRKQTKITGIPRDQIINSIIWKLENDESGEGDILRSHFPGEGEERIKAVEEFYDKVAPPDEVSQNVKNIPTTKSSESSTDKVKLIEKDKKLIKDIQNNVEAQVQYLKGAKWRGAYIEEAEYVDKGTKKELVKKKTFGDDETKQVPVRPHIKLKLSKVGVKGSSEPVYDYIYLDEENDGGFAQLWDIIQSKKGSVKNQIPYSELVEDQEGQKEIPTFTTDNFDTEYEKLSPGSQYIGPDGKTYTKSSK